MLPKEKAEHLYNKMCNYCKYNEFPINLDGVSRRSTVTMNLAAKQCALIAVEEIIKVLHLNDHCANMLGEINYWELVKYELSTLKIDINEE